MRMRAAKTELASRARLLVLHMHPAPRQVCLAAGGDYLDNHDGVARILGVPHNYFAPDAVDANHQQVMRFMHFRRAGQSVEKSIAEFNLLRRKAGSKMETSAGFPD